MLLNVSFRATMPLHRHLCLPLLAWVRLFRPRRVSDLYHPWPTISLETCLSSPSSQSGGALGKLGR